MAENHDLVGALPPGWDRKYDPRTGRYYFINYFNKTSTWEDPRLKYKQLQQSQQISTETPQSAHGSPDIRGYHIYPVNATPYQPQPAFQSPSRISLAQERSVGMKGQEVLTGIQPSDMDMSVAKIGAMFPTVSETHIRALLIKYLKSVFPKAEETVILDILSNLDDNVQKATEQLLSLGFEKRDTPPPRLTLSKREEEQKTQRTQTPAAPPRIKTPEEKNNMRSRLQARYKDIADRLVTFALESVDYDEDRAATILEMMKREEQQQQQQNKQKQKQQQQQQTARSRLASAASAVVALSRERQLTNSISKVENTEKVVESSPVKDDSTKTKMESTPSTSKTNNDNNGDKNNNQRRSKANKSVEKVSRGTSTSEDKEEYRSPYQTKAMGPNRTASRGPNDQLLLVDYMTWNGPNPELVCGRAGLAKGHACLAKGPNPELRKGPVLGLALGSATGNRRHCCEKLITACMRG